MTDDDPPTDGAGGAARADDAAGGDDDPTVDERSTGEQSADGPTEERPTPPSLADERPDAPATVGLVVAALAVAGALPWWPGRPLVAVADLGSPLAAGAGLVALVAFAARRWDVLDRATGTAGAGAAAALLVGTSVVRLVAPAVGGGSAAAGYGLPLTLVAGLVGLGLAGAEYRGIDAGGLLSMGTSVAVGISLTVLGFVAGLLLTLPVSSVPERMGSTAGELAATFLLLFPLQTAGFLVVAVVYVVGSDRGWEFFDLEWPSWLEAGYAALGTVGLLVLWLAIAATIEVLELPSASQGAMKEAGQRAVEIGQPELVLLLVPVMILVVGPVEELMFRNVIQKRLYEAFDRWTAVLVAGVVFAAAHVLAYYTPNSAGLLVSISIIFFVSLLLGALYAVTENVTVTAVAHGLYNSVQVLLLYFSLVFAPQGGGNAGWALLLSPF